MGKKFNLLESGKSYDSSAYSRADVNSISSKMKYSEEFTELIHYNYNYNHNYNYNYTPTGLTS